MSSRKSDAFVSLLALSPPLSLIGHSNEHHLSLSLSLSLELFICLLFCLYLNSLGNWEGPGGPGARGAGALLGALRRMGLEPR